MASREQTKINKRNVVQQHHLGKGGATTKPKWNGLSRGKTVLSRKKANNLKRTPLRKKSKNTIPKLKRELKKLLHAMIRTKYPKCITCGADTENAGHFWADGHFKSVQFDPDNIRGQCIFCNLYQSGNLIIYTEKLMEDLEEGYEQLKERATLYYMDYNKDMLQGLIDVAKKGDLELYESYYFGEVVPKFLKIN